MKVTGGRPPHGLEMRDRNNQTAHKLSADTETKELHKQVRSSTI